MQPTCCGVPKIMTHSCLVPAGLRRAAQALHLAVREAIGCLRGRQERVYDVLTLYRPLSAGTLALEHTPSLRRTPSTRCSSSGQLAQISSQDTASSGITDHEAGTQPSHSGFEAGQTTAAPLDSGRGCTISAESAQVRANSTAALAAGHGNVEVGAIV